ncbi:hypothetical protein D3C80_1867710 [compost metagenome]
MGASWRGGHREIQHETIGRQVRDSGSLSVLVFQEQAESLPAPSQPDIENNFRGISLRGRLEGAADRACCNGTECAQSLSLLYTAHDDDIAPRTGYYPIHQPYAALRGIDVA